jgi:hypothetical protein
MIKAANIEHTIMKAPTIFQVPSSWRDIVAALQERHTNHSKAAMQKTATAASPLIMVNISSSQLDIEQPPRFPATQSAR